MPLHVDRLLLDIRFSRMHQVLIVDEQQMAGLRARAFEHDVHQRVDKLVEHDLA
jgi:hypothetical protein